jgi:hypothetical protein
MALNRNNNEGLRQLAKLAEDATEVIHYMLGGMDDESRTNTCKMLANAGAMCMFANADLHLRKETEVQSAYMQTVATLMLAVAFAEAFVQTMEDSSKRADAAKDDKKYDANRVNKLLRDLGLEK